jgi:hypothetical protein
MTKAPFPDDSPQQSLAGDLSFASQQTLLCWLTDAFTDPIIAHHLQEKLDGHIRDTHGQANNFIAEAAGDVIGAGAFVGLRQIFPNAFAAGNRATESLLNPFYERLGRRELHLAARGSLNELDARRLESWKQFEADGFVKSNVQSLTSTVANALIMKHALHSGHRMSTLFISKFAATCVTTGLMVGLRLGFPQHMRRLDDRLTAALDPFLPGKDRILGTPPESMVKGWRERLQQPDDAKPLLQSQR